MSSPLKVDFGQGTAALYERGRVLSDGNTNLAAPAAAWRRAFEPGPPNRLPAPLGRPLVRPWPTRTDGGKVATGIATGQPGMKRYWAMQARLARRGNVNKTAWDDTVRDYTARPSEV